MGKAPECRNSFLTSVSNGERISFTYFGTTKRMLQNTHGSQTADSHSQRNQSVTCSASDIPNSMDHFIKQHESLRIAKRFIEFWKGKSPGIFNFMKLVNEVGWFASFLEKPFRYRGFHFTTIQDYMTLKSIFVWVYNKKKET